MALKPGTWLGQYEILALLGVGGMGEVYHARDSKLNREVALKLLPEQFARDPERIARLRREAQVLASLDHPNIARIYAFEETGSHRFLVMEYILGDTLRDCIKGPSTALPWTALGTGGAGGTSPSASLGTGGPVPIEEALSIAKQIAEGLEHAHEKPIVHRDLKPANVKVTPEGLVKILDFGLAKAFAGDAPGSDPANSPTLSAMTAPGTILGTAAYMSPEQARGKKVDRRADIWALGCVLFELLSGQWPFQSRDREGAGVSPPHLQPPLADARGSDQDTIADILGAVLHKEPDWSALPAETPPSIRTLLRRCLQKDATKRYHAAADVALEIEEVLTAPAAPATTAPVPVPAPVVAPRPVWQRAFPLALTAMVAAVIASIAWNLRQPTPRPIERLVVPLTAEERLPSFGPILALSPDGTQLAYRTARGIYVRAMDSFEARLLPGTENANDLFFSPDGQWLGFFAGGLKKVSVSGGAVLSLTNTDPGAASRGASWGPNDTSAFSTARTVALSQVAAAGGEPQALTKLKAGERSHRWPQFLPDGQSVLFTVQTAETSDDWHIAAQRLDAAEHQILIRGGTYARYVPTGHLVYYRGGTIMAVPFDAVRLEVIGAPAPVLEGVMARAGVIGSAQFSFSSLGSLAYVPGGPDTVDESILVWVDRNGREQPLAAPPQPYNYPRFSPDGRRLLVEIEPSIHNVWVYDLERSTLTRLTFEATNHHPIWTTDGKRVTFSSNRSGVGDLYWKPADGSGTEERLTTSQYRHSPQSWSPDGKTLIFVEVHPTTREDIEVLPLEGDRKPRVFLKTPFRELTATLSPDGRWLAYVSDESGRFEVYVQPFPGPGGKWQISTEGGTEPVWGRSGRELFYRNGNKMMAVDIATNPTLVAGTPKLLFEGEYASNVARVEYDVSPDGQRFLMLKPDEQQAAATQISVVLN